MAQQALKHIVKKVVSASAVVAVTDDCKDEMDEIAHLVFGAGTITPKYDSSGTIVSATTPPPGQPLQVHSNPRTNAAIIDLGRRMASNASIQKGVIETINQSGWLMYGAGSMCLPLEDWDDEPGVEHEEIEPGAVPLSDDEDWPDDFDDGTDLKAEEPLARSYPHMSITGGAPVRSNSVPLLSAHKITTDDVESPDFSPTISPTPSYTSSSMSDETASTESLPSSSSSLTDSMREYRRQRAERARKQPGIFQSFAGWIQSFFMPIPTSTSAPTSTSDTAPSTATASEEKHGVVHREEGHAVVDEKKQLVSTTSTSSSSSTTTSTSTSTSKSSYNNMISAALGVATVIIVLLATKRVLPCMFTKLVAYLRR